MAIQIRVIDGMGSVTETSPGVFATTGMMTADHMGIANDFVGRAGVLGLTADFKVAQRGAGANMSVDVPAGVAYVLNSSWTANSNTHTRYWSVINDATVNVAVGANASGNPRIDIVTLKVDTAATPDGNASNVGSIVVTAGTPAASPSAPATPSNHLLLAYVAVANGAVSIVTANITDKRVSVYLDTNPTASGLADLGMARQAIINGNFDVWQRGTTVTGLANGGFIADRFKLAYSSSGTLPTTIIHSQQSLTVGDIPMSKYFYRINPNGAGSGFGVSDYYQVGQAIENGTSKLCGAGRTVTISFYARSSIASKKLNFCSYQSYGTGGSPSATEKHTGTQITLTSSWVKYTYTFTTTTLVGKTFGNNNDDFLQVQFVVMQGSTDSATYGVAAITDFGGSGNIDIAQVQLCSGDVALPFQPKTFNEEYRDCRRFFRQSYPYGTYAANNYGISSGDVMNLAGGFPLAYHSPVAAAGTRKWLNMPFDTPLRGTPSATAYYDLAGNATKLTTMDTNGSYVAHNIFETFQNISIGANGVAFQSAANCCGWAVHWTASAEL